MTRAELTKHLQDDHPGPYGSAWRVADEAVGFNRAMTGTQLTAWLRDGGGRGAPNYHEELHRAIHLLRQCDHVHESDA